MDAAAGMDISEVCSVTARLNDPPRASAIRLSKLWEQAF
jgi:hypothetical protein